MTTATETWRRFMIDVTFAREYPSYFLLASRGLRQPPRNPVLDKLLPSLLQVKSLAILDFVLQQEFEVRGVTPKQHGYREDLCGRLNLAGDLGIVPDCDLLHEARKARNEIAHEFSPAASWDELAVAIQLVHKALESLGVVGPMPDYQIAFERVPKKSLENTKAVLGFDYRIVVTADGVPETEMVWSEEIEGVGK